MNNADIDDPEFFDFFKFAPRNDSGENQSVSVEDVDPTSDTPQENAGFEVSDKMLNKQTEKKESSPGYFDEYGMYHFELEDYNLYLSNGQVRSGKSFALRALLIEAWHKFDIKFGVVFSCTPWNGFWQTIMKPGAVKEFSIERLEAYMDWLATNHDKLGKNFLVIEDAVGTLRNGAVIDKLVANYRWYDISFLAFATQKVTKMPPIVREQACLVLIFKHYTKQSLQCLYETFGSSFYSFKEFVDYLREATSEKHRCLIYRMNADVDAVSEKYISWKAPEFDKEDKRNKLKF